MFHHQSPDSEIKYDAHFWAGSEVKLSKKEKQTGPYVLECQRQKKVVCKFSDLIQECAESVHIDFD